jgi:hypothetical protein
MTALVVILAAVWIVHEWATIDDDLLSPENDENSTHLGSMF